jgi:hypothetical protein
VSPQCKPRPINTTRQGEVRVTLNYTSVGLLSDASVWSVKGLTPTKHHHIATCTPCLSVNYLATTCKGVSVYVMMAYMGSKDIVTLILNLGTKWRSLVNFTLRLLYSRAKTLSPGIHWIDGRVGPRAGLEVLEKKKLFVPGRNETPDRPFHRLVATLTTPSPPTYRT